MSRVLAIGGGGFLDEHDPRMHRYILAQSPAPTPSVCLLATGKGDAPAIIERFYNAFGRYACQPTHLALFDRDVRDVERFVLDHHVVLVWGGNTASMLAVWRAHGVDTILRQAATRGVVLAGLCAGALAWFEGGVTDSFGSLDAIEHGLGLLPGSFCPYYDADPERRSTYHRLVRERALPPGFAADVDAALRFDDGVLSEVVASRAGAQGWRVTLDGAQPREEPLAPRLLDTSAGASAPLPIRW